MRLVLCKVLSLVLATSFNLDGNAGLSGTAYGSVAGSLVLAKARMGAVAAVIMAEKGEPHNLGVIEETYSKKTHTSSEQSDRQAPHKAFVLRIILN